MTSISHTFAEIIAARPLRAPTKATFLPVVIFPDRHLNEMRSSNAKLRRTKFTEGD